MEILKHISLFIGLLAFTWLFVEGSVPVEFIKKLLKIHNTSNPKGFLGKLIQKLVNCCLCSGFWFGLIYYQNILLACLVSIGAEIFCRGINYLFYNIWNKL